MHIKTLRLSNFRNYSSAQLEFSPYTNVIYGNNAQGKTNILEAVYLFSQGRSHRARSDKELIRFGEEFAKLNLEFSDERRDYSGQMQILKNGRKAVSVNHVHIVKLSALMNYLNVVMFSPEDLDLVKGSPGVRRRFIDSSISQLYPSYLSSLIDYNKALNQKNSLLKLLRARGAVSDPTLDIWNEQLALHGTKIMRARSEFAELINTAAKKIQAEISGELLGIKYVPSIKTDEISEDAVLEKLKEYERREIDAASFGSQGQQRTAALSLKIAQADYIKEVKGEYPVLLLDDIMSELDINRRMYLAERIRDKQVLITSTDTDLIDKATETKLFRIENGTVVE